MKRELDKWKVATVGVGLAGIALVISVVVMGVPATVGLGAIAVATLPTATLCLLGRRRYFGVVRLAITFLGMVLGLVGTLSGAQWVAMVWL